VERTDRGGDDDKFDNKGLQAWSENENEVAKKTSGQKNRPQWVGNKIHGIKKNTPGKKGGARRK